MSRTPISRRAANRLLLGSAAVVCVPGAGSAFEFLSRQQWQARAPIFAMPRHQPRRITIHHTAVPGNANRPLADKLAQLQRFSQQREKLAGGQTKEPWGDLPYHYYIGVNGVVGEGRSTDFAGDTNTNYDTTGHIAVVLEGNFEIEIPAPAQIDALVEVLAWLMQKHAIDISLIDTHNAFASTACPGRNLLAQLPGIVARAEDAKWALPGSGEIRRTGKPVAASVRPIPRPTR